MAIISTTRATERLSRKLQRAGINQWIGKTSGDKWGNYLFFEVGGKCVGSAGWTLADAEAQVDHAITYKDCENAPPAPQL
jgi:hypothetical protein